VQTNNQSSKTVHSSPQGSVGVPLIGDIPAAGLTATELADLINQKFSRFVKKPNVEVIFKPKLPFGTSSSDHERCTTANIFPTQQVSLSQALQRAGVRPRKKGPRIFLIRGDLKFEIQTL
jgi:hypothetical protein